ncbi:MAG: acetoacetate--CoA ligase [Bacteriovoracaceae bacterium]|nr:acetoacetate--CoA ligase [Bacteriovoracaceae bacterium]
MSEVFFSPGQAAVEASELKRFERYLLNLGIGPFKNYFELHQWSIENPEIFWKSLVQFFEIPMDGSIDPVWKSSRGSFDFSEYGWFPKLKVNFAKALLESSMDERSFPAIEAWHENGTKRFLNRGELIQEVSLFEGWLSQIIKNETSSSFVIAAYMPNITETVIAMLATASLGGVFTSTSCDFGIAGVVDRFIQSKPTVLVMCSHYTYGGKIISLLDRITSLLDQIPSIKKIVLVDFLSLTTKEEKQKLLTNPKIKFWSDIKNETIGRTPLTFVEKNFQDPLYIMYSSGTTGRPKCMVHSIGGTLLQHCKELSLHLNVKPQDKIFFFTTCGWMMWNWLLSALALKSTIVLFEGSPSYPSFTNFMNLLDKQNINFWGTSPKFLRALEIEQFNSQKANLNFSSLKAILSTGSPLVAEQYDFAKEHISSHVPLVSMSGGTDIVSCFMLGVSTLPVHRGQLQAPGLGMHVVALDGNQRPIKDAEGELACLSPFISMPIYFLNDPDKEIYQQAYFSHPSSKVGEKKVWFHGDYIKIHSKTGGVEIFGRSDATLNPGGVRIGTAEIYRQTEKIPSIVDSLCVSKSLPDGDVDIYLFVKLKSGTIMNKELKDEIKTLIRSETTPRHVPKQIIQVYDIPYTRSGKKVEIAVMKIINGREINNLESIANPECLEEYKKYAI